MPIRRVAPLVLFTMLAILAGCSASAPPIQIVGDATDLERLAGTWHGTFRNTELRRGGQIDFRMSASSDSAFGEITMYTDSPDQPIWASAGAPPDLPNSNSTGAIATWRRIRFVRIEGGYVSGQMEPYYESRCNCWTVATFVGRLKGNVMEGSYTSRGDDGRYETSGSWHTERTGDFTP